MHQTIFRYFLDYLFSGAFVQMLEKQNGKYEIQKRCKSIAPYEVKNRVVPKVNNP
jgi:hypothetical protein